MGDCGSHQRKKGGLILLSGKSQAGVRDLKAERRRPAPCRRHARAKLAPMPRPPTSIRNVQVHSVGWASRGLRPHSRFLVAKPALESPARRSSALRYPHGAYTAPTAAAAHIIAFLGLAGSAEIPRSAISDSAICRIGRRGARRRESSADSCCVKSSRVAVTATARRRARRAPRCSIMRVRPAELLPSAIVHPRRRGRSR